jgi:hypothetical protein
MVMNSRCGKVWKDVEAGTQHKVPSVTKRQALKENHLKSNRYISYSTDSTLATKM